jgi:hypothetical protein
MKDVILKHNVNKGTKKTEQTNLKLGFCMCAKLFLFEYFTHKLVNSFNEITN